MDGTGDAGDACPFLSFSLVGEGGRWMRGCIEIVSLRRTVLNRFKRVSVLPGGGVIFSTFSKGIWLASCGGFRLFVTLHPFIRGSNSNHAPVRSSHPFFIVGNFTFAS